MRVLVEQPSLTDLHTLIAKVPKFPISAGQLVEFARKFKLPRAVMDFYNTFPRDEVFADKDDLQTRTEQVEMLHHDSSPMEIMNAPED